MAIVHKANHLYVEYKNLERRIEKYAPVLKRLEADGLDKILFTDKLPRMLTRHSKIDGITPVGKCKTLVFHGDSYALLDKLPAIESLPEDAPASFVVSAVKLGDEIHRGNVPKYLLNVTPSKRRRWKICGVKPALTKQKTPELVRLYPVQRKEKSSAVPPPSFSPKLRASQEALKQAKVIQISSLAEALLPKEKGIRPDVHWNDKPDAQDKAIRDEEKLYKGWER